MKNKYNKEGFFDRAWKGAGILVLSSLPLLYGCVEKTNISEGMKKLEIENKNLKNIAEESYDVRMRIRMLEDENAILNERITNMAIDYFRCRSELEEYDPRRNLQD